MECFYDKSHVSTPDSFITKKKNTDEDPGNYFDLGHFSNCQDTTEVQCKQRDEPPLLSWGEGGSGGAC